MRPLRLSLFPASVRCTRRWAGVTSKLAFLTPWRLLQVGALQPSLRTTSPRVVAAAAGAALLEAKLPEVSDTTRSAIALVLANWDVNEGTWVAVTGAAGLGPKITNALKETDDRAFSTAARFLRCGALSPAALSHLRRAGSKYPLRSRCRRSAALCCAVLRWCLRCHLLHLRHGAEAGGRCGRCAS